MRTTFKEAVMEREAQVTYGFKIFFQPFLSLINFQHTRNNYILLCTPGFLNSCRWKTSALSLQIVLLLKTEELNQCKSIISYTTQFMYVCPIHVTIIYFGFAIIRLNLKQVMNCYRIFIFQMQAEVNSIVGRICSRKVKMLQKHGREGIFPRNTLISHP